MGVPDYLSCRVSPQIDKKRPKYGGLEWFLQKHLLDSDLIRVPLEPGRASRAGPWMIPAQAEEHS